MARALIGAWKCNFSLFCEIFGWQTNQWTNIIGHREVTNAHLSRPRKRKREKLSSCQIPTKNLNCRVSLPLPVLPMILQVKTWLLSVRLWHSFQRSLKHVLSFRPLQSYRKRLPQPSLSNNVPKGKNSQRGCLPDVMQSLHFHFHNRIKCLQVFSLRSYESLIITPERGKSEEEEEEEERGMKRVQIDTTEITIYRHGRTTVTAGQGAGDDHTSIYPLTCVCVCKGRGVGKAGAAVGGRKEWGEAWWELLFSLLFSLELPV